MRHPVMHEQRDARVGSQIACLSGVGRGGHDDCGMRGEWRVREVCVGHEGDVGGVRRGGAGGEVELFTKGG